MARTVPATPKIRVLIADHQRVVREGLALLLGLMPDLQVVAAAACRREVLRIVGAQRPDVVLLGDLRLPGQEGLEIIRCLRRARPGTQVIALTSHGEDQVAFATLRAGARGYLTPEAGAEEIAQAIRAVVGGDALLDPRLQRRLVDTLLATPDPGPGLRPEGAGLTPREGQVLRLMAQGLRNGEIARTLGISEATIKTHINHLFAKAGLRDRAQAVSYAYRTGVVTAGR